MDLRSVLLQNYTTIRQHHITIAAHNTAHTQGERSATTAKHFRSPGNAPNLTGTHEEVREQAGKELH